MGVQSSFGEKTVQIGQGDDVVLVGSDAKVRLCGFEALLGRKQLNLVKTTTWV